LWEEVTVSVSSVDLSVFSVVVKSLHLGSIWSQVIVFLPLAYEALTAYSTLFRIQIFNYYRLIPQQETDANSIMFSAAYLCRLCAPLSYNFMTFLHLSEKTSFEEVMGTMDFVPFLGNHFYLYFPLLIILVCAANLFNLSTRILQCLHIKRFQFDENFSDSAIEEGAQILERERARGASFQRAHTKVTTPVELLSLSTPLKEPEKPTAQDHAINVEPPRFSKYGHSTRFSQDDEITVDDEANDESAPGSVEKPPNGFPAMSRIFGKGRHTSDGATLLKHNL